MYNNIYLKRLDHLRFYAISIVAFFHFKGRVLPAENWGIDLKDTIKLWINQGSTGVSLFLVLSGFLFTVISDAGRKEINYWMFIKNRVLRIFPLLTVVFFVILCVGKKDVGPIDILRLLFLQLNTGTDRPGWGEQFFPVGVIWTIAVEFQFYLIFPFLALFLKRYGPVYILSLIITFMAIRFGVIALKGEGYAPNFYSTIIGRIDQFLIGIIAGYLYVKGFMLRMPGTVRYVLLISSLALLTIYLGMEKSRFFIGVTGYTIEGVLWVSFLYMYITVPFSRLNWLSKMIGKIGMVSYSMYLLHLPVAWTIVKMGWAGTVIADRVKDTALYLLPAVIIFSFFTYYTIERPFLSMKVKYFKEN
ncbi:acyltransferase [Citrobacter koseri]|uniref:acyltransferase family protein n=1 Tax=Citrobacter koseri TaxID=545 RepID=UPI0029438692|nr:acyltransferase [Citrobacter koseri]MEB2702258.1 acyltransferase [Citrobacter koseri]MEB2708596.1 acyltransferase [Citrobacter koseri]MEB2771058.1 acyltransferase [Citrobacter koseri]WOJ27641.1 acyltransferase [Citrobacter koseri]